jgi:hypothetical protein
MNLQTYEHQIRAVVPTITRLAPDSTILGEAGETAHTMVRAYAEDGTLFLRHGDPVNAIAAFGYAEGWLEGGIFLGLIRASTAGLSSSLEETLDPVHIPRLVEKAHRYHRLLSEGIRALEPAPDEASVLWKGCGEILVRSETALRQGAAWCSAGNFPDALRRFGYGHGWLDTGVRTGLFRIVGLRELFTV